MAFLPLDTNARARRPTLEVARAPRPEPRVLTPATAARLVALALGLRLISAAVGFLANVTFPVYADQRFTVFDRPHAFWDTFARYDAGWYFGIAAHGYTYVEGGRSNLAFFPLYPLLMRLGGQLMGGEQPHFYLAGIAVSWAAFVGSMLLLYRLARLDLSHEAALRATAYAGVFPSAYFFGRIYSESLFLLALVGTVLALRLGRWPLALVLGTAMTATRVNGITLVPALLWIGWEATRGPPARASRRSSRPRAPAPAFSPTASSTTRSAAIRWPGTTASSGGATTRLGIPWRGWRPCGRPC